MPKGDKTGPPKGSGGKRDGSGPFEGSCQHEEKGVGKKKHKGEECPYKEDEDK